MTPTLACLGTERFQYHFDFRFTRVGQPSCLRHVLYVCGQNDCRWRTRGFLEFHAALCTYFGRVLLE